MSTPRRVADINPGEASSYPRFLTAVGNTLFFAATDGSLFTGTNGSSGIELWKTDGITTSRVADINPGFYSSNPVNLTAFGNTLLFTATDPSSGIELWKTDGINTSRVTDINFREGNSYTGNLTAVGNTLFFTATDVSYFSGTGIGIELWKTDGTITSPVADINPGWSYSSPSYLTAVGNTLFFTATDGSSGIELWKTDGITTSRVADIRPGADSSFPKYLTAVGNNLFFSADIGGETRQLWKTDGITTSAVPNVYNPRNLTAVGNTLFFSDSVGGTSVEPTGQEVWKTDGTTTSRVTDINPGRNGSYPSYLTAVGTTLFFYAFDGSSGLELWAVDVDPAEPSISLSVSPASVTEDGAANLVYTFSRTGATTGALSVNYTVAGSATLGTDYTGIAAAGTTKTVAFAAGSATAVVTVNPTADTTIEAKETVALTLAAGTGYTVGTATAVSGTIRNDDIKSAITAKLDRDQSSLLLTGTNRINGTGNALNNSIFGNTSNNRILGGLGKDILTGGGTTDSDTFVYNALNESLLGGYDVITDFNSRDRILTPFSVETATLTASVGSSRDFTAANISRLLTTSTFAANTAAAFAITGVSGTLIALNDNRAGFQPDSDTIIQLRSYTISSSNAVELI